MRIGIDARLCGVEHRGIGRYTEGLLRSLILSKHELIVFTTRDSKCLSWLQQENIEIIHVNAKPYSWEEQTAFLTELNKAKCDITHFPHFTVPLFYNRPYIVTIHDLILHHFPNRRASTLSLAKYWMKYLGYRLVLANSIYRSNKIITVSDFSKEDILDHYNLSARKIEIVTESMSLQKKSDYDFSQKFWYNKFGKYVLYVGAAYPHKNLTSLITAWQKVGPEIKKNLVLAIPDDPFGERLKVLSKTLDLTNMPNGVFFFHQPTDEELYGLYSESDMVVTPSKFEGVGLPGLEALFMGKPLLSSAESCLAEVYGKAATYFSIQDEQSIVQGILRANQLAKEKTFLFPYKLLCESGILSRLEQIYTDVIRKNEKT